MKLVDRIGANQLVIAQGEQLRPANKQRVETGDARSGYGTGIRIVEVIVVNKVIAGNLSHPAVAIKTH